jgi:hypothetical protein
MTNGSAQNGHQGHVTVEGTVQTRNERGVQVDGQWLNLSRFKPIELPDVGARVRAEVDNRGFLCMLEVLEPAPAAPTPAVVSDRDARITRLAVLKAAANFLGLMSQTREDVRSEHVLILAEKWLTWVED